MLTSKDYVGLNELGFINESKYIVMVVLMGYYDWKMERNVNVTKPLEVLFDTIGLIGKESLIE